MIFAAFLSLFLLPFPFFLPLSHSPPANAKSSGKGDCTWVSLTEQECALYLTALFAPPCSALCRSVSFVLSETALSLPLIGPQLRYAFNACLAAK